MMPFFFISAFRFLLIVLFFSYCLASSLPAMAPVPSVSYPPDTVQEACHMAWKDGQQYTPCVAALRSSPWSRNATLVDLAVLSTALAFRDASAILKRMRGDVGGATYWQRLALAECLSDYRRSISTMEGCIQEIRAGHYGAAGYALDSALDATGCGGDFLGVGEKSVKEKTKEIGVFVGVAKAVCYKYCRKVAKYEKDCLF